MPKKKKRNLVCKNTLTIRKNNQGADALYNQYEFINHLKKRDVIAKDELDHAQEHHGVDSQRTLQSLAKLMIIREITHEYKKITGQDE